VLEVGAVISGARYGVSLRESEEPRDGLLRIMIQALALLKASVGVAGLEM
jgi:hypothetical protein